MVSTLTQYINELKQQHKDDIDNVNTQLQEIKAQLYSINAT